MNKPCRNSDSSDKHHKPAQVGVYCTDCMTNIRRYTKRRKALDNYAKAVEFGAGDLWRV